MFCPFCGRKNPDNAARCGTCGAELPKPERMGARWLKLTPGAGIGCLLALAAIAIMILSIVIPQYRLYHMQINLSKNAVVRSNMKTLQMALDQYSAEYERFPATLDTAGAEAVDQGMVYVVETARRLRNPFEPATPAVVLSPVDPPDWAAFKPGQVVYVPLDTTGNRAQQYIIYGIGKNGPLSDVMRGGYGQ